MLKSGWILPDMYEISCVSCSTFNGHIEIVKRYLQNLKAKDLISYNKIQNFLRQLQKDKPYLGLDDFAVIYLGWIKINNDPINIIFYTENHQLEFMIEKYRKFGYTLVTIEMSKFFFTLDIPSRELI